MKINNRINKIMKGTMSKKDRDKIRQQNWTKTFKIYQIITEMFT